MPAKKRARPAASRRTPARKPAREPAPRSARKAAAKPQRKPVGKAAPKPAPKPARKISRKTAAKPRRGVTTLPIPRARSRGPKRKRRAPEPQEVTPQIVIDDTAGAVVTPESPAEIADGEQADARRYVAVVSEIEGTEPFPAQQTPLFAPRERRAEVEAYSTDIPIALGAALLVVAVFLPWYKGPKGVPLSISGWTSGTLAPFLLFLGLASIAVVALRRGGATVSLPVEESLAHEAVGWLALVAAVVKTRWKPDVLNMSIQPSTGVWIAILAAALLVIFGGRMSPRAPLVMRPGWARARGGTIGAALLVMVVVGAALFGVVNSPSVKPAAIANPDLFKGTVRDKLPDCAKDFPLPTGLKPELGFDTGSTCQAQLTSTQGSVALIDVARTALTNAKWTFTEVKGAAGSSVFSITKPRCATLAVVPTEKGSLVALAYTACRSPTPSPSSTAP